MRARVRALVRARVRSATSYLNLNLNLDLNLYDAARSTLHDVRSRNATCREWRALTNLVVADLRSLKCEEADVKSNEAFVDMHMKKVKVNFVVKDGGRWCGVCSYIRVGR